MSKKDKLVLALAYNNEVRIVAGTFYYAIRKTCVIHQTNNIDYKKFIACGLLNAPNLKGEEDLLVKLESKEIEMSLMVDRFAQIKGDVEVLSNNVITEGTLSVVRTTNGKAFTSSIPIGSYNVDDIFTEYYLFSEQVSSCMQVYGNDSYRVTGFLLQLLPGASDETKRTISSNLSKTINSMSIETILNSLALNQYHIVSSLTPLYHCNCSFKKYYDKIAMLSEEELKRLLDEEKLINVICPFCHKNYNYTKVNLTNMIKRKVND
jgi:molecular chaperone Hsp33